MQKEIIYYCFTILKNKIFNKDKVNDHDQSLLDLIDTVNSQRLLDFKNKDTFIIKYKIAYCFGFPHFVHTMEYFYSLSEIIIKNQYNIVLVIQPDRNYRSNYVNEYFKNLLSFYNNFIFTTEEFVSNYTPNKNYFFDRRIKKQVKFLYKNKLFNGNIQEWFKDKTTADEIIKKFFPNENLNNKNKIKIGLVNRIWNRKLINKKEICKKIRREFGIIVDITYFENKSFREQISFFNNHDIIISPHGAQLCSIPFLPKDGLIIECCSEEWHPYDYFPGLSMDSSKIHVMICNDHSEFPKYHSPKYQGGQKKLNIKIDSNIIIEAIKYFIEGKLNNEQIYLMDNEWSFKDG